MATKVYKNFEKKILDLSKTIKDCNDTLISDEHVDFIYDNANFLTKSFLISLCGYLESYLKDVLELLIMDYNDCISRESIPYNLVRWSIENKEKSNSKVQSLLDTKKRKFESFSILIGKSDLDAFISGNPYRTKELFSMFGIDLESLNYYRKNKETIAQIVAKRNSILHHNDDASDLSNSDVIHFLGHVNDYCIQLDIQIEHKIKNQIHCV